MKRNSATLISGGMSRRGPCAFRWGIMLVLSSCLLCPAQAQHRDGNEKGERNGQGQGRAYSTVFYKSGNLQIEAYLFKPEEGDRFPVVIYNHGSRGGQERKEVPFAYVAKMLTAHGYAVLVPERRGYGKSDGPTFTEEVGARQRRQTHTSFSRRGRGRYRESRLPQVTTVRRSRADRNNGLVVRDPDLPAQEEVDQEDQAPGARRGHRRRARRRHRHRPAVGG